MPPDQLQRPKPKDWNPWQFIFYVTIWLGLHMTWLIYSRAQLLAARQRMEPLPDQPPAPPLIDRLRAEWEQLKNHVWALSTKDCPMEWWRQHNREFPLLGKYWLANSSFPATSASAERAFNMDGLIFTSMRFVACCPWIYEYWCFSQGVTGPSQRWWYVGLQRLLALACPSQQFFIVCTVPTASKCWGAVCCSVHKT